MCRTSVVLTTLYAARGRYDTITEGIGIDRLTKNFAMGLDDIKHAYRGTDQEAVEMANYLLRNEGKRACDQMHSSLTMFALIPLC